MANRDYRMVSAEGEVLLTGTSQWPLIDMTTRRAMRLHNVIEHYENHDIMATEFDSIDKIALPEMTADNVVARHPATYSMIDHTRHVNNSEYIKILFDCLNMLDFDIRQPFRLELNYQLESRLGEMLEVSHITAGNIHYLQISNPRSSSVTARVTPL